MRAIFKNVLDNPILTRELRRRMRGKALVYSIIGYIILMTLISILILLASMDPFAVAQDDTQKMLEKLSDTGSRLFRWITLIQALLVLIIAPTITAGMTTGEKEKKTFDFLRVTTITPWMYITGCFLSTVFYVGLALICALPLISLAFLYGGIGSQDVLRMGGILLGMSMVLSAFGLLVSSVRERTRTAQGIVVFMIFSFIFGGAILYNQISIWLGTSSAAAGAVPAGGVNSGGIMIFNYTIPGSALIAGGMILLTVVLLLVATRKLFDPEETRALSHWQFGFIALAVIGIFLGMNAGSTLTDSNALLFLSTGCILLVVAAVSFAVGRMEVGDEIWHMKRLLPFLRPIDQTIPFLILVGGGWYFAVQTLNKSVTAYATPQMPGMINAVMLVSLASYAFFVMFGRFATAISIGRKGAGRLTLAVMLFCWIVLPIFVALVWAIFQLQPGDLGHELFAVLGRFSPFFAMIEGVENSGAGYDGGMMSIFNMYMIPLFGYGLLTVGFMATGEIKRFKRWRKFDYHYDMPAA